MFVPMLRLPYLAGLRSAIAGTKSGVTPMYCKVVLPLVEAP